MERFSASKSSLFPGRSFHVKQGQQSGELPWNREHPVKQMLWEMVLNSRSEQGWVSVSSVKTFQAPVLGKKTVKNVRNCCPALKMINLVLLYD